MFCEQADLDRHNQNLLDCSQKNQNSDKFKCVFCDKKLANRDTLTRHQRTCIKNPQKEEPAAFGSNICGIVKKYWQYELDKHMIRCRKKHQNNL